MRFFFLTVAVLTAFNASPAPAQDSGRIEENLDQTRPALKAYAECMVQRDAQKMADALSQEPFTRKWRTRLGEATRRSGNCYNSWSGEYDKLIMDHFPLAGAVSEAMILQRDDDLARRLGMAMLTPIEFDEGLATLGQCIVSGAPHYSAQLLQTEINSPAEQMAAEQVRAVATICTNGQVDLETSAWGLLSLAAIAAYCMLAAREASNPDA